MAVIINEVEVVVEQAPPPGASVGANSAPPQPLQPPDVAAILARQARIQHRLAAH